MEGKQACVEGKSVEVVGEEDNTESDSVSQISPPSKETREKASDLSSPATRIAPVSHNR